jgi:hypothetical protein
MTSQDQIVLALKKQLEDKKKELIDISTFKAKTNLVLTLFGSRYNLNVSSKDDIAVILGHLLTIKGTLLKSESQITEPKIEGFTLSDWIHDLKGKYAACEIKEKKNELEILQKKLDKLISKELSDQIELAEIIAKLK